MDYKILTVIEIKHEMEDLIGNSDYEAVHSAADKLLLQVLLLLATDENRADVQAIVDAFDQVGKWYA